MTSKSKTNKIVSGFLGLMLSLTLVAGVGAQTANAALATSQVDAIIALLTSFGADASTITNVRASLTGGTPSAPATSVVTSSGSGYTFTRNLKQGDTGADVKQLQMILNSDSATQVSASGVGSKGMETTSFGPGTKAAVVKFQNKYASEILTPNGLTSGTGSVGNSTRAKLNAMGGATMTTTTTTTPTTGTTGTTVVVPSGGGLSVSLAPMQPAAQLVPLNAARVPFTKVVFTAGASDVTVNGIVVERTGQSIDGVLDSVILLDETGTQVGLSKTLNSQHQATLTQSFVVKAGTSRTMTLAGNRPATAVTGESGMIVSLSLAQVNTGATVSGSFPMVGTAQTINSGLTIGVVTAARGSLDPGTSVTKEVGITGYTFSSVRLTAGSGENVRLRSIRWNQTQSASASDLANIKVYVDGTAYDAVMTDGGQYYSTTFGSGIVIEKGFSKEISIKGDVIGGSGRKVDFDIAKRTDINLSGELYGYGIMPGLNGSAATTDGAGVNNADDYYYDAAEVEVSVGTMNISTSNAAPAQNIAVNTANQPLGAFIVDVKGEAISVGRLGFNVNMLLNSVQSSDDVDDITNITLVDANGSVVAGPVDGTAADSSNTSLSATGSFVFSDTVTFPVGQNTYFIKGKIGTDVDNNTTIQASSTPSVDFATVRGLTTGKTITPAPASALTFSQMTLKSGSLTASSLSQPPAQTVIAGGKGIEFARYVLDATASGENIRVTTLPLDYSTNGTATDLTNCQLRDGTKIGTSLTTGSNTKNPTAVSSTTSFTFDGTGLLITKGTSKTLSLTCDLKSGTAGSIYSWGLVATAQNSSWTGATGLASAQEITEVFNRGAGLAMTASAGGSYTVSSDSSSSYDYRAVKAGTLNVPLAAFKFEADLTEELMLKQIALQVGNVASNSPADLENRRFTLWVDGVEVGSANFDDTLDTATTTISGSVKLGKGPSGVKTVVVKGDLRTQDANTNSASTAANGGYGAFFAVTYDGNNVGINGNYATGVDSGAIVSGYTTDVTTNGVRIFKNVPTIRVTNLGANSLVTGDPVYKFTVTNPDASSDMMLYKVSFGISTSGAAAFTVQSFELRGAGVLAATAVNAIDVETAGVTLDGVEIVFDANEARRVPAGGSKEYVLSATVAGMGSGTNSLNVKLLNDTAYPYLASLMGKAGSAGVDLTENAGTAGYSSSTNNIIWSPFSTTSPTTAATAEANLDWTNSYGVPIYDKSGTLLNPTGTVSTQASEKAI